MGEYVLILLIFAADGRAAIAEHIYFSNSFACERVRMSIGERFNFAQCFETNRERP
jgi:hypothetical protein